MRNTGTVVTWIGIAFVWSHGALASAQTARVTINPLRDAYFGELHLHTSYSFDAYVDYGTVIDPELAYRFAKGETVEYLGQPARRRQPLDFMAITDHGESIGVFNQLEDPRSAVSRSEAGRELSAIMEHMRESDGRSDWRLALKAPQAILERFWKFREQFFRGNRPDPPAELEGEFTTAWQRVIDSANRHNQPGRFTTFIGYEWTSFGMEKTRRNLHRNILFRGDTAPYPFTSLDSRKPEDLWAWLENIRKKGHEALAIPHNGNASNGLMYDWVDSGGRPIDAGYAARRATNEPLSEIAQTKGASETHPLFSTSDEQADFEILDFLHGPTGRVQGSYLRDALGRGLVLERRLGVNPFKYGFVGGSDLHSGLSISAQADFPGGDAGANLGGGVPSPGEAAVVLSGKHPDDPNDYSLRMTAGALTGVWAESNTRASIYDALRRREAFATSGTALRLRFFGGWSFDYRSLQHTNWLATAYASGVPMGADLPARPAGAGAPGFLIWAVKDPQGANLDRVQIIKVWEEQGEQKERVFDVCQARSNVSGAPELRSFWKDPEFDPRKLSAYYLRVLEIPTPRWSTLLAKGNGLPLPQGVPAMTQQRGWSSPIWYGDTR